VSIKVGDRVKVTGYAPLNGQEGTVIEVDSYPFEDLPIYVNFPHLPRREFFDNNELEVIS
jgi:hypothetical protein